MYQKYTFFSWSTSFCLSSLIKGSMKSYLAFIILDISGVGFSKLSFCLLSKSASFSLNSTGFFFLMILSGFLLNTFSQFHLLLLVSVSSSFSSSSLSASLILLDLLTRPSPVLLSSSPSSIPAKLNL